MLTFRSSSLDMRFACNGSLLAESLVSRRESDEGTEGSLIHYLIAKRLVAELGATEPEGGLPAPRLPKGYELPAFSAWLVDFGVEHVRQNVPPEWILMVEAEFSYEYQLPRPVWIPIHELSEKVPTDAVRRTVGDVEEVLVSAITRSGHLDWLAISPDYTEAKGGDWKSVVVAVEPAESNWQAASYITLVHQAWPEIQSIKFQMIQPRIDEEATGIERVSSTTLAGEELDRMDAIIIDKINSVLENRYTTNSGMKQCRYCALALTRPQDCPSLQLELQHMKATLTPEALAALRQQPRDGLLGDFVISGRTLTEPIKAATEMLHERLDVVGFVDADCGTRITRTSRPGAYEIPNKPAFAERLRSILPQPEVDECASYSTDEIKKRIAKHRGIPQKSSKPGVIDAKGVFDMDLRPLTTQKESRLLQFSNQ